MSKAIEECGKFTASAATFDNWLADKLSKQTPLEIAVSARLAAIVKEVDSVLAQKLADFTRVIDQENAGIKKATETLNKKTSELDYKEGALRKKSLELEDKEAKLNKLGAELTGKEAGIKTNEAYQTQLKETLALKENDLDKQSQELQAGLGGLSTEQKAIEKAYTDIFKKQSELQEQEQAIKAHNIDNDLDRIREANLNILKQLKEIEAVKDTQAEAQKELSLKAKNLADKELNLNAYKDEIEYQMTKLKQELETERRKMAISK